MAIGILPFTVNLGRDLIQMANFPSTLQKQRQSNLRDKKEAALRVPATRITRQGIYIFTLSMRHHPKKKGGGGSLQSLAKNGKMAAKPSFFIFSDLRKRSVQPCPDWITGQAR